MHEYSIVQAMFEQIERTAEARHAASVRRVRIGLGAGAGVDPGLLLTAYETFRIGTMCAEAPLDIDQIPVRWVCPCGHGALGPGLPLTCEICGSAARLEGGDEIILERLELEVL